MEAPRDALLRLAAERRTSLAELSAAIGRNPAYLQQFVRRGSPRVLAERDRRTLARFLGADETLLGGEAIDGDVAVPYLTVAAAAGAGTVVNGEERRRPTILSRAMLREAGVAPRDASLIDVTGDSMMPTMLDGDRLLVDTARRSLPPAGGIMVVRRDDALLVKRVCARRGAIELASDNPAYPPIVCAPGEVAIVGRAALLLRAF